MSGSDRSRVNAAARAAGPRPFALERQGRPARRGAQSSRRVQKGVTQTLGLGPGQFALEHQTLGEGDEVLGQADQLDPAGVVGEVAEGQVAQPGVFGTTDAVLDAGMAPVAGFEVGDVGVGRVGDEDLVAPAGRVKEVELGAVVGSSRRTMARVPSGQRERSRSVSSATSAPSRISQSAVMASVHAVFGRAKMASRTAFRISKPMENSMPRSTRASTNL